MGSEETTTLRPGELRLVEAARSMSMDNELCDLSGEQELENRTVDARVLRKLLSGETAEWGIDPDDVFTVALGGAHIVGYLGKIYDVRVTLDLQNCTFDGFVNLLQTTFHSDVRLTDVTFSTSANFNRATFKSAVSFTNVRFASGAQFSEVTFAGQSTSFGGVTVSGDQAQFARSVFVGDAYFNETTFGELVSFGQTIFSRNVDFYKATFTGKAYFDDATFTQDASFNEATFHSDANFKNAIAENWIFESTTFEAPDPGPWVGGFVSLKGAALESRSRISISAPQVDAPSLRARDGVHLTLQSPKVNLCDSDFARPSLISGGAGMSVESVRWPPQHDDARRDAVSRATELRTAMASRISALATECRLESLERCTTDVVAISDVALDDCRFAGAHGLDRLRIGADCSLKRVPRWWRSWHSFTPRRMYTSRRLLQEEIDWRKAHTGPKRRRVSANTALPARQIAGIYRDMRKGLEDVKNEPDAADSYYGEMEMRRLARRETSTLSSSSSVLERVILYGYWAVSGYGLSALRAVTTLAFLLLGAAALYSFLGWAVVEPPQATIASINLKDGAFKYHEPAPTTPGYLTALNYAARESISLLHGSDMQINTTGFGTILDYLLRLAGPVLLAFIILALRARTKR